MTKKTFAVTGATGNIGGKLTRQLLKEGHAVRAIARGDEKLRALAAEGAEIHLGSVGDAAFLKRVFEGVDGVFAMIPPDYAAKDMRAGQRAVADAEVEAVRAAGVKRVVALSSFGAHLEMGTGPIAGLHYFEQRLGELPGVDVVFLRAGFFMENLLQNIPLIRSAGINGSPLAADVAEPMIATQEIAAAAAAHLTQGDFQDKSVHYLLGARDVRFDEATRTLGSAIGKPDLPYVQFSYDDARKAILAAGISESVADGFIEMYRAGNEGHLRPTQSRSPHNTTPTTLEQWSDTFAATYKAAK